MSLSYGATLPDSEPLVASRLTHLLALLPSFSSFLSSHVNQSRDYSAKLSSLIGSYRKSTAKEASERGGEQSTLELALAGVLEQMDLQAREVGSRAEAEAGQVAEVMDKVGGRLDAVRKKHHHFYTRLLAERDRSYEQRDKSKSLYYSACESLESARQKKAAAKEGRDTEKASRAYDAAMSDMLLAKNQYLLDLDAANVSKERLYNVHLPALHDDYQLLEQSATLQFVKLVERMIEVQRESLERLMASVGQAKEQIETVQVERDQQAFVERYSPTKLAAWEVPPDAVFEECPVWHDTDAFSTTPPSVVYLQNVKVKSATRLAEISPALETKRREIGGLRNLREAYEREWGLGDTVGVIENLFGSTHEMTLLEINQTELKAQIELIDATLGDAASTGLRPHEFKPSSFVTPSTCAVCEGSVWGKGLSCKKCSMAVHAKCELKVPAGCAARPGAGIVRAKSKKAGGPSEGISTSAVPLTTTQSSSSTSSASSVASTTLPPPRRTVPPAGGSTPSPVSISAQEEEEIATLLYDYSAASAFELTVSEADIVHVVEPEDESGWVKVRTADGRVGLVPGSYLQLGGDVTAAFARGDIGGGEAVDACSAAGATGQEVVALYDYTAQGADEISIREGERAELTVRGMEVGEGWAEVIKDGQTGMLPASYIQLL
ncbi:hypothetical protein JCM1841_000019 [Sporobolomyces salmonicolor]